MPQEMLKGVEASTLYVRIGIEIKRSIEERMSCAPFSETMQQIVQKGRYTGRSDIWVTTEIPFRIEQGMGRGAARRAPGIKMEQRIDAEPGNDGMLLKIPLAVEERMRRKPLPPAPKHIVPQWIACRFLPNLRISRQIPIRIEEDALAPFARQDAVKKRRRGMHLNQLRHFAGKNGLQPQQVAVLSQCSITRQ